MNADMVSMVARQPSKLVVRVRVPLFALNEAMRMDPSIRIVKPEVAGSNPVTYACIGVAQIGRAPLSYYPRFPH